MFLSHNTQDERSRFIFGIIVPQNIRTLDDDTSLFESKNTKVKEKSERANFFIATIKLICT